MPSAWPSPTTTSAPSAPGERSTPCGDRVRRDDERARRARRRARVAAATSSRQPSQFGWATTTTRDGLVAVGGRVPGGAPVGERDDLEVVARAARHRAPRRPASAGARPPTAGRAGGRWPPAHRLSASTSADGAVVERGVGDGQPARAARPSSGTRRPPGARPGRPRPGRACRPSRTPSATASARTTAGTSWS